MGGGGICIAYAPVHLHELLWRQANLCIPIFFSALLAEGDDRKAFATGPGFNASAAELQEKHSELQVQSWIALLENVARKSTALVQEKTFGYLGAL